VAPFRLLVDVVGNRVDLLPLARDPHAHHAFGEEPGLLRGLHRLRAHHVGPPLAEAEVPQRREQLRRLRGPREAKSELSPGRVAPVEEYGHEGDEVRIALEIGPQPFLLGLVGSGSAHGFGLQVVDESGDSPLRDRERPWRVPRAGGAVQAVEVLVRDRSPFLDAAVLSQTANTFSTAS
jgi:hypothetical protein